MGVLLVAAWLRQRAGGAGVPDACAHTHARTHPQVKRVLEPDQFREFSANIKKLNAGQQSVDETLEKVREIFGEHRPFLFAQLQKLIRQVARVRSLLRALSLALSLAPEAHPPGPCRATCACRAPALPPR